MDPNVTAERAVEWVERYPDEWDFMIREAVRESQQRGWASIHNAADRTRMYCNVRIPNAIKPALSRLLVIAEPRLDGYLVMNKASIDEVDLEGMFRERGLI